MRKYPVIFIKGTLNLAGERDTKPWSHLSINPVGFLASAVQEVPPLVLNVTNMDVVAVALAERNPGAAKHQQVVAVQDH